MAKCPTAPGSRCIGQNVCTTYWAGNIDIPFHRGKKHGHHWTSDWNSLLRRTWCIGTWGVDHMLEEMWPGNTTVAVWLSVPIRDCSCFFTATVFVLHSLAVAVMWASLFGRRLNSICTVSIWMSKKGSWQLEPSVLWAATGTPSSSHTSSVCWRAWLQAVELGGPSRRKSSSNWVSEQCV